MDVGREIKELKREVRELKKLLITGIQPTEEWISEKEAMGILNVSKDYLKKLRTAGTLPFRYRETEKKVDSLGRTVRRGIQYNKIALNTLYKTIAV
jgi:hypothetical protein